MTQKEPISGARGFGIVMGAMVGIILVLGTICVLLAHK
jgi:hypothetical protein